MFYWQWEEMCHSISSQKIYQNLSFNQGPNLSQTLDYIGCLGPLLSHDLPVNLPESTLDKLYCIRSDDYAMFLSLLKRFLLLGHFQDIVFISSTELALLKKYHFSFEEIHDSRKALHQYILSEYVLSRIAFQAAFSPLRQDLNFFLSALEQCVIVGEKSYAWYLSKPQRHALEKMGVYDHFKVIQNVYYSCPELLERMQAI